MFTTSMLTMQCPTYMCGAGSAPLAPPNLAVFPFPSAGGWRGHYARGDTVGEQPRSRPPAWLNCTSQTQQPRGTNCTVSPTSVSLDGTNAALFTVKVTTTARAMAGPQPHGRPGARGRRLILPLIVLLFGLAVFATSAAPRRWKVCAGLASSLVLVALWASCGGGGGGGAPPPPQTGTPAGTYSLTVTATASGVSHSTTLTLKVN